MKTNYKIGDPVRFNAHGGSVGRICAKHSAIKDYYYAEWVYGRDVAGDRMTAVSGGLRPADLVPITEEEVKAIEDRKGWGSGRAGKAGE